MLHCMLHGIYLLIYKQFVFLKLLAPKKIFGPTRDEVLYVKKIFLRSTMPLR